MTQLRPFRHLLVALPLFLAACAGLTPAQQVLTACEAHDAAVRALVPQVAAGVLSQAQVSSVDASIVLADTICDGTVVDYSTALSLIEAELLRMAIIQGGS